MFKSGRGVLCTDFLVVLGHFGGRSFIYVVVLVGSSNSDFLFAELRSGKGDLLRSTLARRTYGKWLDLLLRKTFAKSSLLDKAVRESRLIENANL